MALELFEPDRTYIRELCSLKCRAFNSFNLFHAALPTPLHEHEAVQDWFAAREAMFYENPDQKIVAVRDTASGRAVAYTRWSVPSPHNEDNKASLPLPDGARPEVLHAFFQAEGKLEHKYFDVMRDWQLVSLATDPDFAGKGCGKLMLQHITNLADQAGVKMHVNASIAGEVLYARYGFTAVERISMDLSQYGGETDARVGLWMIRDPKPALSESAP